MPNCKFIYKNGRTFESELALDEFLLKSIRYWGEISDEVFEFSTEQLKFSTVLDSRERIAKKIFKGTPVMFESDIFPDYEFNEFPDGTIGNTKFLQEFEDENGKKLFPVFEMDNLWNNIVPMWNNLDYWKSGIMKDGELKQASYAELMAVYGHSDRNVINKIPEQTMIDSAKKTLEKVWSIQSFIGTGIHKMLDVYWNCVQNRIFDEETIKKRLKESIENWYVVKNPKTEMLKQFSSLKLGELISDEIINQTFEIGLQIQKSLKNKFGDDLLIRSETSVISQINYNGETTNLSGNIDLMVVDKDMNIHIIDYKTSPKNYSEYNKIKIRTFEYQLAVYRRMIELMGVKFNKTKSSTQVIPIKFLGFEIHPEANDLKNIVTIKGVQLESPDNPLRDLKIGLSEESDRISTNINKFLPLTNVKPIADSDILVGCENFMKRKFKTFVKDKEMTLENVKKELIRRGADKLKTKSNKYETTIYGKHIYANTFEELCTLAYKQYNDAEGHTIEKTIAIKGLLQEAIDKKTPVQINNAMYDDKGAADYIETILNRYAKHDYEILDHYEDACNALGIILLKNKWTNKIDVLVVDTNNRFFNDEIKLGNNKNLLGSFISDIEAKNMPNELTLTSCYGNLRLMEVMAALNQMDYLFSEEGDVQAKCIGEIQLISLKNNVGLTSFNEELLYNFTQLHKLDNSENEVKLGKTIQMASYLDLVRLQANEILSTEGKYNSRWDSVKSLMDAFEDNIQDPTILINKLTDVVHELEKRFHLQTDTRAENLNNDQKEEAYTFIKNIYSAISELSQEKNTLRQQLNDHHGWMNQTGLSIFTEGWSGNNLDNPGMLDSDILNSIGKQVNVAYLNTRDEIKVLGEKIFNLSAKLKQSKNFGYIKSRTLGNESKLYMNMYDESVTDDLLFVNPFDLNTVVLNDVERDYLKNCLFEINKRRFPKIQTMDDLRIACLSSERIKYLRVPLLKASGSSKMAYSGIRKAITQKFRDLLPTKANIQETFNGLIIDKDLLDEDDHRRVDDSGRGERWEMRSRFAQGDSEEGRKLALNQKNRGRDYWERNLEVLTLNYCYQHDLAKNVNKVFPIIKAAAMQLEYQGFILNKNFAKDLEYLHNFIKAKILNESIQDERWDKITYISGKLMSGASKLALAFNPHQLYQALDGIWKDISLVFRLHDDGQDIFTKNHFIDSFWWIYKDLTHDWGDKKSFGQLINEQYGINDMDMNTYIDKILPNRFGIWHFDNVMFHFASRPDYYNRMTIFGAKMKADGCFDAHDKNTGKYNWTKDKRYEIFAQYYKNENIIPVNLKEEYNKQKELYHKNAELFVLEHAKYLNENNELVDFVLDMNNPKPLPRAYTILESESIKSLSDMIYGYYSHEKKSLVQSFTAGALAMLMNTFWSSKKNQFMAPGGVRMQGHYEHYYELEKDENGNLVKDENGETKKKYTYLDKEGNITFDVTDTPNMIWKGQYQEGIIVTLSNMLKDSFTRDDEGKFIGIKSVWDKYYNAEDANLRIAYRNNLRQLFYDLIMWILLGMIIAPSLEIAAKEHKKDTGNAELGDTLINNVNANLASMLKSSADDFNATKSIFGRGIQWTPFSITTLTNTTKRISSFLGGNSDFYDTLCKLPATGRSQEDLLDYIKIETLGRKIGDNGKN